MINNRKRIEKYFVLRLIQKIYEEEPNISLGNCLCKAMERFDLLVVLCNLQKKKEEAESC